MCQLSIVIVHYNTPDLLRQCLASVFSSSVDLSFEVIVIDNASRDVLNLPEVFPRVTFHFNKKNVGFATACNQGIRMGSGRYVLLLNPDTIVSPESLQ